jgi:CBS domain-containing protein
MKHATAGDVMNPEVFSVPLDMSVLELVDFLAEKEITGVPVVDNDGRFVGVVSVTDVASSPAAGAPFSESGHSDLRGWEDRLSRDEVRRMGVRNGALSVGDIMTPAVYTVPADTPASELARTMVSGRIHRLFVTRGRKVVGIVTSLDLLKLLFQERDGQPGR